ncbi:hypothetical protein R3P38DRAFT_3339097, partial [Favolaschia claudopus]
MLRVWPRNPIFTLILLLFLAIEFLELRQLPVSFRDQEHCADSGVGKSRGWHARFPDIRFSNAGCTHSEAQSQTDFDLDEEWNIRDATQNELIHLTNGFTRFGWHVRYATISVMLSLRLRSSVSGFWIEQSKSLSAFLLVQVRETMQNIWTKATKNQIQGTNERARRARERERQEADCEFRLDESHTVPQGNRYDFEELRLSFEDWRRRLTVVAAASSRDRRQRRWSPGDGEKLKGPGENLGICNSISFPTEFDGRKLRRLGTRMLHMLAGIFGVGEKARRPAFTYDLPQSYIPRIYLLTRIINYCS